MKRDEESRRDTWVIKRQRKRHTETKQEAWGVEYEAGWGGSEMAAYLQISFAL